MNLIRSRLANAACWKAGFWFPVGVLLLAGTLLLAGCKGVPTQGERAARDELSKTTASYRPNHRRPDLPVLTSDSNLSNYLAFALLNSPTVEAAYYDWAASVEQITVARSLPDPQITFQMDIQRIVTSVMPGLMGNIPWPGKLRHAAAGAAAQSEAKHFAFESAVLENAFEVKRVYFQLALLSGKIRVNRTTLALVADLEKLARAQNEVGKATLQDVLRAQIEQDRLRTETANLEDSRNPLLAQFKAALGLKAGEPDLPLPGRFDSTPLETAPEAVLDAVLERNNRLKALAADVRSAEASLQLARESTRPDFSLGLMADVKMDPTLYRPLGTLSLPIWRDKIAAQIAAAQAEKRSAEARLSAGQVALAVDLAEKSFRYREATRTLTLLRGVLLPKARQSLEVARSGYLSGQIDFFNLSDSQRTLLGFELDEVEAAAQREQLLAELSLIAQGMSPVGIPMAPSAAGTARDNPAGRQKMGGGM